MTPKVKGPSEEEKQQMRVAQAERVQEMQTELQARTSLYGRQFFNRRSFLTGKPVIPISVR